MNPGPVGGRGKGTGMESRDLRGLGNQRRPHWDRASRVRERLPGRNR